MLDVEETGVDWRTDRLHKRDIAAIKVLFQKIG
jgi:hypothetical protein